MQTASLRALKCYTDQYEIGSDYGRASFDTRHRSWGMPRTGCLRVPTESVQIFIQVPPYNVTVGQDLNGDTQFNDRQRFSQGV